VKEPGEERRLLAHATSWLQRLIIAALETGCGRGEPLSFTWADVDLQRGLLTVRAENAKSGIARQVPISHRLKGVLQMTQDDPAGRPHKSTAFVFGNSVGEQIKDPKNAWAKCCRAAGIPIGKTAGVLALHFTTSDTKRAAACWEAGWPLHHVHAVLGHADAKTTSTYLNATVQHLLDSMRRFGSGGSALQRRCT